MKCFSALFVLLVVAMPLSAQDNNYLGQELNTITTAVPFLMISPDARAGAMGDAGVSSEPDANSMHWNPAKYAFIDKDMGFSISYSPWLRELVDDINLAYLSGYKRIDDQSTIAASLVYFSLGDITFTDVIGNTIGNYKPNEFAVDATYSRKLSKSLSGAVALRYIYSNLTQGQFVGGAATKPGTSLAADVAVYYEKKYRNKKTRQDNTFAWGINISNIGAKISYSDDNTASDFLPTNLRIGPSYTFALDEFNEISFMVDINKLLVPTPPVYDTIYINGEQQIKAGMDPDVGVVTGMIHSFYDAPGGFTEEMHEISYAIGAEYWYDKQFAVRAGYFHEHETKGNRKFFTVGAGLKYNVFGLDFSYLIAIDQRNPLENTLRFSLLFDFDAFSRQNKEDLSK
jgi:hypothetical protein